jgi:hypothetical protein
MAACSTAGSGCAVWEPWHDGAVGRVQVGTEPRQVSPGVLTTWEGLSVEQLLVMAQRIEPSHRLQSVIAFRGAELVDAGLAAPAVLEAAYRVHKQGAFRAGQGFANKGL